jgi:AcrR family transcriptional regulator
MRETRAGNRPADWRGNQRGRVLTGMLAAVNADGYARATVSNATARAGVSRTTFYQHFTDKDDCFLSLYRDMSRWLLDKIADAVSSSPPEQALRVAVEQLIEHAEANPVHARFLVSDALAEGPRALQERQRTIDQIARKVPAAQALATTKAAAPDLPARTVIGTTQRLIAQRLRRGERHHERLGQELAQWLTRYERPIGKHRWTTLNPGPYQHHVKSSHSEPTSCHRR